MNLDCFFVVGLGMGIPALAARPLDNLLAANHGILAVISVFEQPSAANANALVAAGAGMLFAYLLLRRSGR